MPVKSFQGWTRVAIPPEKPLDPVAQWKLDKEHGTILCEGDRGHEWLRYDRELTNFLLHVEWRFEKREGWTGYNSGVFVRNDLDGPGLAPGPGGSPSPTFSARRSTTGNCRPSSKLLRRTLIPFNPSANGTPMKSAATARKSPFG